MIGEENAKETREHCLPGIYHVILVLTKVEPQTRFQF